MSSVLSSPPVALEDSIGEHEYSIPNDTANTSTAADYTLDDDDEEEEEAPVDELIRHWRNERCAPELLPHCTTLLDSLVDLLTQQSTAIAPLQQAKTMDSLDHFRLMLVQTDIERINWLIRGLVRCRMHKIEKFGKYLLNNGQERKKMSSLEQEYAERYVDMVSSYFSQNVVSGLPEILQDLDEPDMITTPELEEAVFARVRKRGAFASLPDNDTIHLEKGTTHLLRYSSVRHLVINGAVELV